MSKSLASSEALNELLINLINTDLREQYINNTAHRAAFWSPFSSFLRDKTPRWRKELIRKVAPIGAEKPRKLGFFTFNLFYQKHISNFA